MSDVSQTPSSVLPSSDGQVVSAYKAGVEITAGTFCYLDDTELWQKVDADSATGTEPARMFGYAVNHAYANQYLTVCFRDPNFALGGTVVVGTTYVASTTAGATAPRADLGSGDYVVNIGPGVTTSTINLNPTATGTAI